MGRLSGTGWAVVCWMLLAVMSGHTRIVVAEVFTAMDDIQALLGDERKVVGVLKDLVKAEKQKMEFIEKYIDDFSSLFDQPEVNSDKVVAHPVNAFLLVKHLSSDWQRVRHLLMTNLGVIGVEQVEHLRGSSNLLGEEDMKGAVEAIVRLQHTYSIDEESVANGRMTRTSVTSPKLTTLDCYLLGLNQAQLGFHDYAIRWLEVSLKRFEEDERNNQPLFVSKANILDWLQHSTYHRGNVSHALAVSEQIKSIDPDFANVQANIGFYQQVLSEMTPEAVAAVEKADSLRPKLAGDGKYESLCRGEGVLRTEALKNQRCYLETYGNPALLLQPVKYEVIHVNPDIFMLHDVVFDSQIERIKAAARKDLRRAMVVIPGTDQHEAARIRISKSAFLKESADPVIPEMNARIGLITNLNMEVAEDLQIANYGIGGHYDPHYDHFRTKFDINHHQIDAKWGDRIATFLLYMTDVDAGGATVFPRLNLTLYPVKGSAAFWFNLHRDGLGDENTLHAGCPVLSGTKWISNKWIREKWQDRTRPCGPQPDSPEWENGWPKDKPVIE
ncbi:Prolyl 4-hydroxylase subunit alpha-2 [Hypsibius exemplaris]|uniref:procollagen-proline 4-dioxygenase n=1 Tax=Hypsibius exemplaris TaxID=2072580 RepID=A0A9X6NKP3_HYPEX|nr:Prolyl 4-hydroxylase subunit alpha-2 [Hypsibius exemplaris]